MKFWLESSNFAGMMGKEIDVKFLVGGCGGGLFFLLRAIDIGMCLPKGVLNYILLARNWTAHLSNSP